MLVVLGNRLSGVTEMDSQMYKITDFEVISFLNSKNVNSVMSDRTDHIIHYETLERSLSGTSSKSTQVIIPYFHPELLNLSQYFNDVTNCFIKDIQMCLPLSIKLYKYYNHSTNSGARHIIWFLNNPVTKVKLVGCVLGYNWRKRGGTSYLFLHLDDCTGTIWCECNKLICTVSQAESLVGRTVAVHGFVNLPSNTGNNSNLFMKSDSVTQIGNLSDEIQFWEVTMLCRKQLQHVWELEVSVIDSFYTQTISTDVGQPFSGEPNSGTTVDETTMEIASPNEEKSSLADSLSNDSGDNSDRELSDLNSIFNETIYLSEYNKNLQSDGKLETSSDDSDRDDLPVVQTIQVRYTMNQYKEALLEWFLANSSLAEVPYLEPMDKVDVLSQILDSIATVRFHKHPESGLSIGGIKQKLYADVIANFASMGVISVINQQYIIPAIGSLKQYINSRFETWTKLEIISGKIIYKQVREISGLTQMTTMFIIMLVKVLLRKYLSKMVTSVDNWYLDAKSEVQGYIIVRFYYTKFNPKKSH
ncbi:Stn1p Ecym_5532 [Eremothecium cymbalariae DBVPG|uniref:CST complex subunit Stn1 N-terminal domain-containing protein n=1 Tax=Eremothecium cymbalariae (strain CBS 270.75 / DBVPG 7215 / KCTC 17166 / NRRL Y-17582) TaxID=931890 RepID=I6NDY0_ERECY|nr:hypothetical protein Ecym_5532 [Eremothecium cymbalariae DBVPG\